MAGFMTRLKRAYSSLKEEDVSYRFSDSASTYSLSGGTFPLFRTSMATILAPIQTRIAIDAAAIEVRHIVVDEFNNYARTMSSELNDRLTIAANQDQYARTFKQDFYSILMEYNHAVLVPVQTTNSVFGPMPLEILSLRVGRVLEWKKNEVRIEFYSEFSSRTGRDVLTVPKNVVAISYNPFYGVMNLPNGSVSRLTGKLNLLDTVDMKSSSPNLDMLLQLPFAIRNDKRQQEAQKRLDTLVNQLEDSKYGIAYIDSTERVHQLNRPVANVLLEQIMSLEAKIHNQLGLTENIFNGTATEYEQLLYYDRSIEPLVTAFTEAIQMSFLTRTAITQGQRIRAFPNLFKMASITQIADAADSLTRNTILEPNEVRGLLGREPKKEGEGLRNRNLNEETQTKESAEKEVEPEESGGENDKTDADAG